MKIPRVKSACSARSPKRLDTSARSAGNKQEELEIRVRPGGCDLAAVTEDGELALTNKEGLVEAVKVEGSRGCSGHEMVEFRISCGRSRGSQTLDFSRADFGLFKHLLEEIPRNRVLEGKGAQDGWLAVVRGCG